MIVLLLSAVVIYMLGQCRLSILHYNIGVRFAIMEKVHR